MRKKIFKGIFLVSFLAVAVCIFSATLIFHANEKGDLWEEMYAEANYAERGLEESGVAFFEDVSLSDKRITVVSPDGEVLFDNKANPEEMRNHLDSPEIAEALEKGSGKRTRYSQTLSEQTMYYAEMTETGDVIRLSVTVDSLWKALLEMLLILIPAAIFDLAVSALLSGVISSKITKPINNLDVDNPDITDEYSELSPLVRKLGEQKKQISKQIDKLKRSSEEFETLSKNMSEGLVLLDSRATVLSANPAISELLGCGAIEPGAFFFDAVRSRKITDLVDSALAGASAQSLYEKDGKFCRVIANPVNDGNRIRGVVLLAIDVTYEEKSNAMRREFTANVSHELKTPLTSVYGTSEMIMHGMVAEKDIPLFAERIHTEVSRLMKLINDMLRLSEIDEGRVGEEMRRVDLAEIGESVTERLSETAQKAGISLVSDCRPGAYVMGIPSVLEDIIVNLTVNSIKYNKENGSVLVKVCESEDGKKVLLKVEDNGIGIEKEHLGRVFERFYRVDKSRSKAVGGTGLGLSIVKNGAGLHNAELSIESEPGKGTAVSLLFDSAM